MDDGMFLTIKNPQNVAAAEWCDMRFYKAAADIFGTKPFHVPIKTGAEKIKKEDIHRLYVV